jgi:DNA-binding CsgD family transcriptional regulator
MYNAQMDSQADCADAAASPTGDRDALVLQTTVLVGMLDEIDYGLMVLGDDARIVLANQGARLELGGERFVRRRQDKLAASSPRHSSKIDAALANVWRGQRSLVTLDGSDGELALSFVPLNSSAQFAAPAPDTPFALVILGKRDACEALTLQQYGEIHGLSRAEQALLPAIIRGLSTKAIAQQQGVATNTVRVQLGSIREKTGAKSLRTLMARLTSLPPVGLSFKPTPIH